MPKAFFYKKGMQIQRKYCILIYYAFVSGMHGLKGCGCILGLRGKDLAYSGPADGMCPF